MITKVELFSRERMAFSHIIPAIIAASVALAIIQSSLIANPALSGETTITLVLSDKIGVGNSSEDVVMYRVYVTANSPLPYAGKSYERPPQLYYEVRPPKTLTVGLGRVEGVWRKYAAAMSESIARCEVTYLRVVRVYVYGDSSTPRDPVSGNCATGVTHP